MHDVVLENARMSTVARLAVRVAHEVNNPLFAIQNYLGVIRERVADPEVEERLTRIEREAARISEIVSSLLFFSRAASAPPPRAIDVREVMENAVMEMSVTDDGCGIPYDVGARIFDPFFTTKRAEGIPGWGCRSAATSWRNTAARWGSTAGRGPARPSPYACSRSTLDVSSVITGPLSP